MQRLGQNRSMTIKSKWVLKAHQDENKLPGQVLSDATLRNIDVDSTISSTPINPRPEIMLRMWMLRPLAYLFKEPGSQAGTRMPFASISMDLISTTI
jgi:hypothetical protein